MDAVYWISWSFLFSGVALLIVGWWYAPRIRRRYRVMNRRAERQRARVGPTWTAETVDQEHFDRFLQRYKRAAANADPSREPTP